MTYEQVGATLTADLPAGFHHQRKHTHLGYGAAVLREQGERVMNFELQRLAGLHVEATAARAATGLDVQLMWRAGPLRISVPVRIVGCVEQESRIGFAYGTLLGHPERGEESFIVRMDAGEAVWLEVVAFSQPARWFSRLGGPITAAIQKDMTDRYLNALLD